MCHEGVRGECAMWGGGGRGECAMGWRRKGRVCHEGRGECTMGVWVGGGWVECYGGGGGGERGECAMGWGAEEEGMSVPWGGGQRRKG